MKKTPLILLATGLLAASAASSPIAIPTVVVGDVGNPNDPLTGYGSVSYPYHIGTYEVTNEQYASFLNAVAAADTLGLYDTNMGSSITGGINRSGTSGSFTYSVKDGFANKPVIYVSFWDAARFANWLTTGGTETGVYHLTEDGISNNLITRDPTAWENGGVAVASDNEWYKAAYYSGSPTGADGDGYWLYPTQSNTMIYANDANVTGFQSGDAEFISSPDKVTDVGTYAHAGSHYGTFDQAGNAWEWNDTIDFPPTGSLKRIWRGGSFESRLNDGGIIGSGTPDQIQSIVRVATVADLGSGLIVGFRVSSLAPISETSAAFRISSFSAVAGDTWELTLEAAPATLYELRTSPDLSFTPGTLIGNLTQGNPGTDPGTISGTNNEFVTTDGAGLATVRVTLTGPKNFVRMSITAGPPMPEGFARIPAGNFLMGRTSGDTDTDAPPVNVHVSEFFMATHEVTWELWNEVRTWAMNRPVAPYTDIAAGRGKGATHPVDSVSWYDVVIWCNARSEMDGLTPVYYTDDAHTTIYKTGWVNLTNAQAKWSANGYRLPTEAEWEKAARGGWVSGWRFPWGDTISHANANFLNGGSESYKSGTTGYHPTYNDGTFHYTSPVGSFAPNSYGLYDMAGNVREWNWDVPSIYTEGASDPKGPAGGGNFRVLRGGSWFSNGSGAFYCRSAYRGTGLEPFDAPFDGGFRPARSSAP